MPHPDRNHEALQALRLEHFGHRVNAVVLPDGPLRGRELVTITPMDSDRPAVVLSWDQAHDARRRYAADCSGPDDARTCPRDTGKPHGPESPADHHRAAAHAAYLDTRELLYGAAPITDPAGRRELLARLLMDTAAPDHERQAAADEFAELAEPEIRS